MNNKAILTLLLLLFSLNANLLYASQGSINTNEEIYNISNDLFYYYGAALSSLDSLKSELTPRELEVLKPYLQYADAVNYYQLGDYNNAILTIDSALERFIWDGELEWEARSFLIVGYIAEAIRLNDKALEFYTYSSELSQENRTLGLSKLGLARSQKRKRLYWRANFKLWL